MSEPDVAVVPGSFEDYDHTHPRSALLVVEVADSSLEQDCLSKAMIYAAAEVPEHWIVNVINRQVEVHRDPDPAARRYRTVSTIRPDGRLAPVAFPDVSIDAVTLRPARVA